MRRTAESFSNLLWTIAGLASLGLGVIGIFLPLLPTTPLVLLAAFCFAKGSPRLHSWLVEHPRFGPAIKDWQARGAVSKKGKRLALIAMAATFGLALALGLAWYLILIQALCLGAVAIFIVTRPD
ncbi:MAG: YbaN family protein [Pseudomonadota bacterium]